jgi:hypothetical protein
MPQPTHPDTGSPDQAKALSERQDTLLLSDVPEASALMPGAAR